MSSFCVQASINRDKGCREDAFAEQVLQKVRNAQGGPKGVSYLGGSEVMRENALAHQSDDAAEKNTGGNRDRRSAKRSMFFGRGGLQSRIIRAD